MYNHFMNNLPKKISLYFDGSCLPKNPGGIAGYGWRIEDTEKNTLFSDSGEVCRGPEATNNIAEWAAVCNGIKFLVENKWTGELRILGDSQLVINQINGIYRVKKDTLVPYHQKCMKMLSGLNWSADWIPREENDACDKLSKLR